jgi:hypothetical protein
MADVIPLREEIVVAACPKCGGREWLIEIKAYNADTDSIQAFRCANQDCQYRFEMQNHGAVTLFEPESEDI